MCLCANETEKTKKYPSHIEKLLRETPYKIKCKSDKLIITKYKEISKEFQKVVKIFKIKHVTIFYKYPNTKKFYRVIKSKLKLRPSFPPLIDENNIPTVSESYKP